MEGLLPGGKMTGRSLMDRRSGTATYGSCWKRSSRPMPYASVWSRCSHIQKARLFERNKAFWDFQHKNVDKKPKDTLYLKEIKKKVCGKAKTADKILKVFVILQEKLQQIRKASE